MLKQEIAVGVMSSIVCTVLVLSLMGSSSYLTQYIGGFNYHSSAYLFDDFPADNNVTGQVGSLGWQKTATASVLSTNAVQDDFSILDIIGQAVANQVNSIYLNTQGVYNYDTGTNPVYTITTEARFLASEGGVNGGNSATYRVGWGTVPPTSPPSAWYGIEGLLTDDNYFCVSRSGGVQTRTNTGVAIAGGLPSGSFFDSIKVVRTPTSVSCSVNNSTPVVVTTNIGNITMTPFFQVVNDNSGVAKDMEIDYMGIVAIGLTR